MNTDVLDRTAILAKYPNKKPVCLNYIEMRDELLALAAAKASMPREVSMFLYEAGYGDASDAIDRHYGL